MIETMTVNTDAMTKAVTSDFSNATELADYLATKGMPLEKPMK